MGSQGGEDLSEIGVPLRARSGAPLWRRVVARAIDLATVGTILFSAIVVQLFFFIGPLSDRWQPDPWGRRTASTIAFVVLSLLYELLFLVRSKGQTPGKDIMNLRVVTADGGLDISAPRALVRWLPLGMTPLLPALWMMLPAAAVLAVPMVLPARGDVADLLAGTRVVSYDRDLEDPGAKRPKPRWRRMQEAREARESGEIAAGRDR